MNPTQCHEIVSFSFNADVPPKIQTQHMTTLSAWAKKQPGFVSRQSYFSEASNQWIDHLTWINAASAEAAMNASVASPELAAVFKDMDQTTMQIGHYVMMSA
jgi:hypothetical protein